MLVNGRIYGTLQCYSLDSLQLLVLALFSVVLSASLPLAFHAARLFLKA